MVSGLYAMSVWGTMSPRRAQKMALPTGTKPNLYAGRACWAKKLRLGPSALSERLDSSFSTTIATCKPRRCANPSRAQIGVPHASGKAKITWPNGGDDGSHSECGVRRSASAVQSEPGPTSGPLCPLAFKVSEKLQYRKLSFREHSFSAAR